MRPDSSGTVQGRRTPAKLLGDRQAGLQAVFVKARAEMRAAEPGLRSLQRPKPTLGRDRRGIEDRMIVDFAVIQRAAARRPRRIERDESWRTVRNALQPVHPVGHADTASAHALGRHSSSSTRPRGASA